MGDTFSVLIAGDDEDGSAVRRLAREWAGAGLLEPSAWVTPRLVEYPSGAPPHVRAFFVDAQGETEHDLLELLGARALSRVRVLHLQTVPTPGSGDQALTAVAVTVADLVQAALPRHVDPGGKLLGTNLLRVNLLVPATGVTGVSADVLCPGWEVNAVVAGEDRPGLDRSDRLVRRPGNFHAHALSALASAGALWPGVHDGAFDDHEVDSGSGNSDVVVVVRCSVRALLGEDVADRMALTAMEQVAGSTSGTGRLVDWAQADSDPAGTVASVLGSLLQRGDWKYSGDAVDLGLPVKRELTIKAALSDIARFHCQLLGVTMRWVVQRMGGAAERTATELTVGGAGDYVVRIEPWSPADLAQHASRRADRQRQHLGREVLEREAKSSPTPTPGTWSDLRQLCFSLVDGGRVPEGIPQPEDAGVPVLLAPGSVVPRPDDRLVVCTSDGEVQLRSLDAEGLLAATERPVVDTGAEDELESSRDQQSSRAEAVDAAVNVAVGIAAGDVIGATVAAATLGPTVLPGLVSHAAESDGAALEDWLSRRRDVLLWELAEAVASRRRKASSEAAAAEEAAMAEFSPDLDRLVAARRRLLAWWGGTFLAVLVSLSVLTLLWAQELLSTPRFLGWASAAVVIAILSVVAGGQLYYRALRRFEWDVQGALAAREQAAARWLAARRESRRLERLYAQLLDWGEIIGWMVHDPFGGAHAHDRQERTVSGVDLPAAVALATPAATRLPVSAEHVRACVRHLSRPGWLSTAFSQLSTEHESQGVDAGGTAPRGYLLADVDVVGSAAGARRALAEHVESGGGRPWLAAQARRRILQAVADRRLEVPEQPVVRVGEKGAEQLTDTTFFAAAVQPAVPIADHCWTDSGRHRRRHLVARSVAWVPASRRDRLLPARDVVVRPASGPCAVRVDLSPISEQADVAAFATLPVTVPDSPSREPQRSWGDWV